MIRQGNMLQRLVILLILSYISPTIAAVVLGAWVLRYVYELGRLDPK